MTAIIHLAAVFSSADTDLIWKSNLDGTRNLIDAVKKNAPGARFIIKCAPWSELKWAVMRFPFVYGDGDGHLEELPKHVSTANFHPAMRMSTIHHRDIYTAMKIVLEGKMDGCIVNISDEAPTSLYERSNIAGQPMASSSKPLTNPWYLHTDSSLARSLGFRPSVRTVYQAIEENLL